MQSTVSPGGVGSESLATNLSGELERIRHILKATHGGAQWYVVGGALGLPSMTGQSGKFLTNDGSAASWSAFGTGILIGGVKVSAPQAGTFNGSLTAVAAANAITISIKTLDGSTPSATDPVSVVRRNEVLTAGTLHIITVDSDVFTTISSESTLGCGANEKVRIHVGLIRNAGTGLEICFWTATVAALTNIKTFRADELITTVAEGGAGGADSSQVIYSGTARTAQPMVYLGYIEATSGATPGQWASVDKVVNWQPGVPMPGDMIQSASVLDSAVATGGTNIPFDDTPPQQTEGDQYMALTYTPKAVMNRLSISHFGNYATSVDSDTCTIALFQDSVANALAAATRRLWFVVSSHPDSGALWHSMRAGTTSSTTFKIRAGNNEGDAVQRTITFNGVAGARKYGGVAASILSIEEYHG